MCDNFIIKMSNKNNLLGFSYLDVIISIGLLLLMTVLAPGLNPKTKQTETLEERIIFIYP